MSTSLTITRPDDWHLHLRDGEALKTLVPASAKQFARAIVMPNLKPPVTTTQAALAYRERILSALPAGMDFDPLMTLYLTDVTPPTEIARARAAGIVALKLYPAGATTNSDAGVTDLSATYPTLEAMAEASMPLLVHGEVTHDHVDIFDRERVFLTEVLEPLLARVPGLKIVMEHITTREAAHFVSEGPPRLAATITAHHLQVNRNAMLAGGIRPHHYCLPILKRERDRRALVEAATGGDPRFFLGTDSAPHAREAKEAQCGCAGCFTACTAMELYAEVFEDAGALGRLEAFASHHGPDFYGLPRNETTLKLVRQPHAVPNSLPLAEEALRPWRAGESLRWKAL